jgi:metallophosphoesterase superfamily enzyme
MYGNNADRALTAAQAIEVAEMRRAGHSWQACAVRVGRNEASLRRAMKRFDVPTRRIDDELPPPTARSEAPPAEWAAPANDRVAIAPPPLVVSGLEKILVIPDTHVPFEDGQAFAVMMAAARILRPDTIVFLGDFADFMSVSFHPKELHRRGYTLKEEVDAVNARLDQIQALGASRVVFIKGNHEYRLERYLTEKAPSLFGLVSTVDLFRLNERGWECVEYRKHLKIGKMHFTHDVGHAGIYAHRQSRMAFEGNVVIGHVHRCVMEVAGTAKGPAHVGIALGWLGDKAQIDYMHEAKAAQWTLAFGVAYHERDTGNVHVVPVPIVDYRCVVEGQIVDPLKGTSADRRVA